MEDLLTIMKKKNDIDYIKLFKVVFYYFNSLNNLKMAFSIYNNISENIIFELSNQFRFYLLFNSFFK